MPWRLLPSRARRALIQVFLGYRNIIGHAIGRKDNHFVFTPEAQQWCDDNLNGPAYPVYQSVTTTNSKGEPCQGARIEFVFQDDRDAALFKLFWTGGPPA